MIHLLRFYFRLGHWKLALFLTGLIWAFVALSLASIIQQAALGLICFTGMLLIVISLTPHFILDWHGHLNLALSRTTIFHARLLHLLYVAVLSLSPCIGFFIVCGLEYQDPPFPVIPSMIYLISVLIPLSILGVWLSPWINTRRNLTPFTLIAFLLFLSITFGAVLSVPLWIKNVLPPVILALAAAAVLYPLALSSVQRFEIAPRVSPPEEDPTPTVESLQPPCAMPAPPFSLHAGSIRHPGLLSPVLRVTAQAVWFRPWYLVTIFLGVLGVVLPLWLLLLGDGGTPLLFCLLFSTFVLGPTFIRTTVDHLQLVLVLPLHRARIFHLASAPLFILLIATNVLLVPAARTSARIFPYAHDTIPHLLQWACSAAMLSLLVLLISMGFSLYSSPVHPMPSSARAAKYIPLAVMLMLILAACIVPNQEEVGFLARRFLLRHFWPLNSLFLLASILLFLRHRHTFHDLEIPTPKNNSL